jgi:hypothetical protein
VADQLATPEDLASLLQQDLDRSTTELLIECATAVVQRAAGGQRIIQVVDDETVIYRDGFEDQRWLDLPQRPVTAVTSVTIGTDPSTDWFPQYNRSRLYRDAGWRSSTWTAASGPSAVTVVYTHGYAPGDQRLQLARSATLMLASRGYSNPTGSVTREQIDDYSVQYADMVAFMDASQNLAQQIRSQYGARRRSAYLVRS